MSKLASRTDAIRFSFHLSIYFIFIFLRFSGGQRGVRGEREACQTRGGGGGEGGAQKKCTANAEFLVKNGSSLVQLCSDEFVDKS